MHSVEGTRCLAVESSVKKYSKYSVHLNLHWFFWSGPSFKWLKTFCRCPRPQKNIVYLSTPILLQLVQTGGVLTTIYSSLYTGYGSVHHATPPQKTLTSPLNSTFWIQTLGYSFFYLTCYEVETQQPADPSLHCSHSTWLPVCELYFTESKSFHPTYFYHLSPQ